ncbi:GNAT family N-acetyltransferase [Saccharopolyspora spinosa]|uniref:GNAT family N-acetyltransferase n=1 Tax=Saccharopolyspora spinosa TaxID=60894 RepID=UPI000237A40A|nr:GNAT family N-acetyltransferase [Saccharopolyspora spinosa]
MIERSTDRLIGDAGFEARDVGAEFGYTLARQSWGQGLATEVGHLCLAAAFDQLHLPELTAVVDPRNPRLGARARQARIPVTRRMFRIRQAAPQIPDHRRNLAARPGLAIRLQTPFRLSPATPEDIPDELIENFSEQFDHGVDHFFQSHFQAP